MTPFDFQQGHSLLKGAFSIMLQLCFAVLANASAHAGGAQLWLSSPTVFIIRIVIPTKLLCTCMMSSSLG